jgi:hypothetical protein
VTVTCSSFSLALGLSRIWLHSSLTSRGLSQGRSQAVKWVEGVTVTPKRQDLRNPREKKRETTTFKRRNHCLSVTYPINS